MSNLDPSFTIGSQLVEPLRVGLGLSKKAATEKALALLDRVGIPDPKRTFAAYPHEISGGMAQRVLIAGAVSTDPDLIIADEPPRRSTSRCRPRCSTCCAASRRSARWRCSS